MGNDNAAFSVSDSDMGKRIIAVPFVLSDVGNSASGGSGNQIVTIRPQCLAQLVGTSLYYRIKVNNAYVPISGDAVAVTMVGERVD
jgi:hypothetical protein